MPPGDDQRLDFELTFTHAVITSTLAQQMGFNVLECASTTVSNLPTPTPTVSTPEPPSSSTLAAGVKPVLTNSVKPAPAPEKRIISRDLTTGKDEEPYRNFTRACNAAGISPGSMRKSYLDKARQLKGKHWRTEGEKTWQPSELLCYDTQVDTSQAQYIMSVHEETGKKTIYESSNAAWMLLSTAKSPLMEPTRGAAQSLRNAVQKNRSFIDCEWSTIKDIKICGEFHDAAEEFEARPPCVTVDPDDGQSGRCNGRILGYDLKEQRDHEYTSIHHAAQELDISSATIQCRLNCPRQAKGKVFRNYKSDKLWVPSEKYRFDAESKPEKVSAKYVVSVKDDDTINGLYEGGPSAKRLEKYPEGDRFDMFMGKKGKKCGKGFTWRYATEEECGEFVKITPGPILKCDE
jgi:hypothetical protein